MKTKSKNRPDKKKPNLACQQEIYQGVSKDVSKKMLMIVVIALVVISLLSIGIYFIFSENTSGSNAKNAVKFSSQSAEVKVTLLIEKSGTENSGSEKT